uniref:Uncharacterized protein n=1 Tax=Schistosoma japonicum TaxID=6182 RepID=Q5C2J4_SCHJA|nr:unknown [Schistosoma japonicum]
MWAHGSLITDSDSLKSSKQMEQIPSFNACSSVNTFIGKSAMAASGAGGGPTCNSFINTVINWSNMARLKTKFCISPSADPKVDKKGNLNG